jgi:hypothetical protein
MSRLRRNGKQLIEQRLNQGIERSMEMTRDEAIAVLNMVEAHGSLVIEAKDMAIKALELVEEFEKAQIITGGRLNGRTYAYKCGLEDGKRKALDKVKQAREEITKQFVDLQDGSEEWRSYVNETVLECVEILDKLIAESEE